MPPFAEAALVALTTFFAVIGPIDVAVLFAGLTADNTARERAVMARNGVLIGGVVLLLFVFAGERTLAAFGVGLPALRTAGGLLLFLIAVEMVFARQKTATSEEKAEARAATDITVFPLATPFIAGPGAMGASVLLAADAKGDPAQLAGAVAGLVAILSATYLLLLGATRVQKMFGVTALHALTRVFGVLLAGLAVQFVFDGLASSGLFAQAAAIEGARP